MQRTTVKRLALGIGVTLLSWGFLAGSAGAQATMAPGSFVCKPLSAENFLTPPPFIPSEGMTPEDQEYADRSKLPADLCPPGMIAYPVSSSEGLDLKGPMPTHVPSNAGKSTGTKADQPKSKAKANKAKAKAKKAKANERRKKAKAKAKAKKRRSA